ncbi:uncharacterized protein LOC127086664 [Lathyrus oleraceus]|uniref:uncharacterized protein LOC127086664 n=1 Tax=Pisum sativum TaxID=3888 RepID=UPI0021D3B2B3|nr:uncharacterized protein LOC127086664 [Pisum sativum]
MVHRNMFPKAAASNDVKPDEVNDDVKLDEVVDDVKLSVISVDVELDVGQEIINEQLFNVCEHMFEWVRMETGKLEFGIVIRRSDSGSNRRQIFVTMICERSGTYVPPIRKLKHDDSGSKKCECSFKLHEYRKVDDT